MAITPQKIHEANIRQTFLYLWKASSLMITSGWNSKQPAASLLYQILMQTSKGANLNKVI